MLTYAKPYYSMHDFPMHVIYSMKMGTWLSSQKSMAVGEKYQVMFIVPNTVGLNSMPHLTNYHLFQKYRNHAYMDHPKYKESKYFAMTEIGFTVCNGESRDRKFAMPECRNRLQ